MGRIATTLFRCGQKNSNGLKCRGLGFCTGPVFEWASPTQRRYRLFPLSIILDKASSCFSFLRNLLGCPEPATHSASLPKPFVCAAADNLEIHVVFSSKSRHYIFQCS